jgi:hypothetical protein
MNRIYVKVIGLGAIGAGLGAWAASGAGLTSQQPIWAMVGGIGMGILGAVIAGTALIVRAIETPRGTA